MKLVPEAIISLFTKCEHEWRLYTIQCVTLEPRKRKCEKCGQIQKAVTTWVDVK